MARAQRHLERPSVAADLHAGLRHNGIPVGQFHAGVDGANAVATAVDGLAGTRDVFLHFEEPAILRTHVRLPRVSRRMLHGALAFEIERLSPIPPAELYFDARIEGGSARQTEMEARALRKQTADDAIAYAHRAELAVAGILLGDDEEPADWRHFPSDRPAFMRALWRRWGSLILAGVAALLLVAVLIAVSARMAAQIDELNDRIAEAELRAAPTMRLMRDMAQMRTQAQYVAERKAQPSLVATLAALTDALPDGTWATDVQFDAGTIHVQGYSHTAAQLVPALDRSGRFSNATFTAPLVRNDQDGTDRFELTAKVRP